MGESNAHEPVLPSRIETAETPDYKLKTRNRLELFADLIRYTTTHGGAVLWLIGCCDSYHTEHVFCLGRVLFSLNSLVTPTE